ncbi:Succinyl-CoA ligase [ADP-forming] subunit alpha [Planctomycetes bacterium Pan216]|uniref:Succinyl-CoA ligase [ADP-forming] subunit alpha n=1 Tax=Kolteria novifilia TaxID=2527975 RepID=A0A518BA79_9BACT|nr:Succinyl-CoA ligase [ADP-forming] subunit alpha [Planctomycetes bacterium Pan216]
MSTTERSELDPSHDIFHARRHPLDYIFDPKSVAVIGASERAGSVGRTLLWNLIRNPFGGTVYPINPKRPNVLGIRAYPNIEAVPEQVDLAVIVTPAPTVPGVVSQCIEAGVKGAIIISAGFKELGPEGAELEQRILEQVHRSSMRLIGPNCLGVMNPRSGLNATFAGSMALPGNVALVSQSGALCTAILDFSLRDNVGFSAFVSIGSMLDVDWGDLIQYLGDDPHTNAIVLYMESIGIARDFLSAAREVALTKPIIVIKAGRTEAAAKAAASHTGSLAGSDEVFSAAVRRTGVVRVETIEDLFNIAEVAAKQPSPKGPRLTIVTNAGGPGVLATDRLISSGGELAELSDETRKALDELLPPHWSRGNPIDILGDADPLRYAKALKIAADDPNSDGLLVILTPQDMTDPTMTAETLKEHAHIPGKPVLASWMGGVDVAAGVDILNRAGVSTFDYPDAAARAFTYLWQRSYNLRAIYETPRVGHADTSVLLERRARAEEIIGAAREQGRTLLTEAESKRLLAAYDIPVVETLVATDVDEAVAHADHIGYPVVLKLHSETITHKTDVGGVVLNVHSADEVRENFEGIRESVTQLAGAEHFDGVTVQPMLQFSDAYELIIGSSLDAQFGPVLLFGTGGSLVEVYKDRSLGLPPLNGTLAIRMMEQTKVFRALEGVRGRSPIDIGEIQRVLVRFSDLIVDQPWIKESDINPLLVSSDRVVAVDGRFVLHDPSTSEEELSKPVIRPYPMKYAGTAKLRDGTEVKLRPIRPDDEPLLVQFHEGLSDDSVRMRFFQPLKLSRRVRHERLSRVCFNDYDRELALVAIVGDENPEVIGIGRLAKLHHARVAELSMMVSDGWQRQGLGSLLLERVIPFAKDEQLEGIVATILRDNIAMQKIAQRAGFTLKNDLESPVVEAYLSLREN